MKRPRIPLAMLSIVLAAATAAQGQFTDEGAIAGGRPEFSNPPGWSWLMAPQPIRPSGRFGQAGEDLVINGYCVVDAEDGILRFFFAWAGPSIGETPGCRPVVLDAEGKRYLPEREHAGGISNPEMYMLHSLSALDPKVLEPGKAAYVGLEQRAAGACGEGIFVGLTFGCEDGRVIVGDIIPGSQADKDGRIRFGDELVGIETQAGERIEFTVKEPDDFNEVAEVIGSGEPGSKVRLIVRPKGSGEEMIVELTRNGFE